MKKYSTIFIESIQMKSILNCRAVGIPFYLWHIDILIPIDKSTYCTKRIDYQSCQIYSHYMYIILSAIYFGLHYIIFVIPFSISGSSHRLMTTHARYHVRHLYLQSTYSLSMTHRSCWRCVHFDQRQANSAIRSFNEYLFNTNFDHFCLYLKYI